jgi:hypothetical protein
MKTILKSTLIALFIFILPANFQAQSEDTVSLSKNSIYADLSIGLVSHIAISYERKIFSKNKISLFGRIGAAGSGVFWSDSGIGGLVAFTMLTGKKNSHFELSAGSFLVTDGNHYIHPLVNIGYRYQKPKGGLMFKVYIGSVAIGAGLGYAF